MICFPNAKINLGLYITEKRPDGFHNIESVFYPISWNDALEVIESPEASTDFQLHLSGLPVPGSVEDNLLYKAYALIKAKRTLPKLSVYLHKSLPMGAGLGGGSADCAFFINQLNTQFNLGLSEEERLDLARPLGSDCAFFIKNKPVYAYEKGDVFKALEIDLSMYYIAVIFPNVHSIDARALRPLPFEAAAAELAPSQSRRASAPSPTLRRLTRGQKRFPERTTSILSTIGRTRKQHPRVLFALHGVHTGASLCCALSTLRTMSAEASLCCVPSTPRRVRYGGKPLLCLIYTP